MKTQNKQNSTKQLPLIRRGLGRGFVTIYFLLFTFNSYSQGAGSALDFNGSSDYVDISGGTTLQLTGNVTIEAWVKITNNVSQPAYVFLNSIAPIDRWGIYLTLVTSNRLAGSVVISGTQYTLTSTNTLPLNQWIHLTVVRSGSTLNIYENGLFIASRIIPSGSLRTGSPISRIGRAQNHSSPYFPCILDELRVWNRALTQTEIQENMCKKLTGTEVGLVAYYPMNEGIDNTCSGGEDVCDMSGNGNNGTKF